MNKPELANRFTYHPPRGDQAGRYEYLRSAGHVLANDIDEICPDSREKSLAITNLEQAIMWANAAIARNPVHIHDDDGTVEGCPGCFP